MHGCMHAHVCVCSWLLRPYAPLGVNRNKKNKKHMVACACRDTSGDVVIMLICLSVKYVYMVLIFSPCQNSCRYLKNNF